MTGHAPDWTSAALAAAIESDPRLLSEFRTGWGRESPLEYLLEYRHIPDIAANLAADLGIPVPVKKPAF